MHVSSEFRRQHQMPWAVVRGSCKLADLVAENQPLVLFTNSKCLKNSYLLSHLSIPTVINFIKLNIVVFLTNCFYLVKHGVQWGHLCDPKFGFNQQSFMSSPRNALLLSIVPLPTPESVDWQYISHICITHICSIQWVPPALIAVRRAPTPAPQFLNIQLLWIHGCLYP